MLAAFTAAMDATVVGTALPTIAGELGGLSLYPWIFAGYLLTSTTSVPIWGRLADIQGRKNVLFAGLAFFVGGSVLCGASPNMPALILFRALQGVGAGCIQPVTMTVIGDVFPVAQRARLQGLFSSVWAIAATVDPLIGGVFVTTVGWRWSFFVNVPIGAACVLLLWRYRDRPERRSVQIDFAGVIALTAGVALLLYGLGTGNPSGQPVWPVALLGVVALAAFWLFESRSALPTVPLRFLRHPLVGPALLQTLLAGTVMWGVNSWVPLFAQGATGAAPIAAGWSIATMSVGWPVASTISGRLLIRYGHRLPVLGGSACLLLGTLMLALTGGGGVLWIAVACFVIGLGMGSTSTPLLIVIQDAVAWGERGALTALNQFMRTIGGAVGVSLMGLLVTARLPGGSGTQLTISLQHGHTGTSPLLASAIEPVFWTLVALAAATSVVATVVLLQRRARR